MFRLTVRDRFMIAHSFRGEVFGPAQELHGATYVTELELARPQLDDDGLVVDIGIAHRILAEALATMNYKNLDEIEAFEGKNTTTEFLAAHIWRLLAARIDEGVLGRGLTSMKITLKESDVAWASYEGSLG